MARLDVVYIERGVKDHPRTQEILERVRPRHVIWCEHFGEIFNRKKQDFREQKKAPALILAKKTGRRVLPAPDGYGIGGSRNYYFSHMLNCVFDCRYCFLQGMYPSANYVLFLNFEDFVTDIESTLAEHPGEDVYFYSGYDCDSLALETYSHFVAHYLPFFRRWPQAFVELRTKSVNISPLLKMEAVPNAIVAWSLTPQIVAEAVEADRGKPPLARGASRDPETAGPGRHLGAGRRRRAVAVDDGQDAGAGGAAVLHPRNHLLADITALLEVHPAELVHQCLVREGITEGEVASPLRHAEADAVGVIRLLRCIRREGALGEVQPLAEGGQSPVAHPHRFGGRLSHGPVLRPGGSHVG